MADRQKLMEQFAEDLLSPGNCIEILRDNIYSSYEEFKEHQEKRKQKLISDLNALIDQIVLSEEEIEKWAFEEYGYSRDERKAGIEGAKMVINRLTGKE